MAVDSSGVHGLELPEVSWSRCQTHGYQIQATLSSAEIPSRLEPPGLARDDGERPDGVKSMSWKNGC